MEKQFISALSLTYENAKSLFEEATILKSHKKFGRSYSLFHLCFEECGRFHLIYNTLIDYFVGEIKLKDLNYGKLKRLGYEDHNVKISESFNGMLKIMLALNLLKRGFKNENEIDINKDEEVLQIEKFIEELRKGEDNLNRLKNVGLYVTFDKNEFNLPDNTITVSEFLRIEKISSLSLKVLDRVMEFAESKGGFSEFKRLMKEGK